MDYSDAAADPALHDSSPWGSSSPRANRSGFNATVPDSPVPIRGHSHNQSQDSISANPFASEPGTPAARQPDPPSPEIQASQQQSQEAPSTAAPSQDAPSHQQSQQQKQPQMRPGAARYHNARQQRPVPAYKLQAKVTALERTGRKDPIFRFDVYVGMLLRSS